jgi:hypothetical protein
MTHTRLLPILLVAACLELAGCLAVPFDVKVDGKVATIDVSTLGEYPTSVSRIRLSQVSNQSVVWELIAGSKIPQIWSLTLHVGENSVALENTFHGRSYKIVHPLHNSTFALKENTRYRLELWNESGWRRTAQEFAFAGGLG